MAKQRRERSWVRNKKNNAAAEHFTSHEPGSEAV
jgi:hypothetical protein